MKGEESKNRIKELDIIEKSLKSKRDFSGLISIFQESMIHDDSIWNYANRICQIAYCYARLRNKIEAEKTLMKLKELGFAIGEDFIWRASTLVSFFLATEVSNFNEMQTNTLKNWLQQPDSSIQVKQIVFDYEDIIGIDKISDTRSFFRKTYNVRGNLLEFKFEYSELDNSRIKTLVFMVDKERIIQLKNGVILKHIPQEGKKTDFGTFGKPVDGGTPINEFLQDLEFQLEILNKNPVNNIGFNAMISGAISNHITHFGRLIFDDIDIYINVTLNIINALRESQNKPSLSLESGLKLKHALEKQILEVFRDHIYISSLGMPGTKPPAHKLTELSNSTIFIAH
jgi:hypothetical protein